MYYPAVTLTSLPEDAHVNPVEFFDDGTSADSDGKYPDTDGEGNYSGKGSRWVE